VPEDTVRVFITDAEYESPYYYDMRRADDVNRVEILAHGERVYDIPESLWEVYRTATEALDTVDDELQEIVKTKSGKVDVNFMKPGYLPGLPPV
jgi:hypothetical protein